MSISKGVDLEWAIVFQALKKQNIPIEERQKKFPKLNTFNEKIDNLANKCIEQLEKNNIDYKNIFHTDELSIFGFPEPKTDIMINDLKISVKMNDRIQLSSAESKTTSLMLQKVAFKNNLHENLKFKNIIDKMSEIKPKMLSPHNIQKALARHPEVSKQMVDENLQIKPEFNWKLWRENNKDNLNQEIQEFVKENTLFFEDLIEESLTGKMLFGSDSKAAATHILSPNKFCSISKAFVQEIKEKVKIDVRAKSRGGVTTVAFRIELK